MNQSVQSQLEQGLDLLEVEPNHGWDDIEKHYRQLVQRWHPDRNAGEGCDAAQNKFIKINSAYKLLREYYRKTGAVPRRLPAEQQGPLLGTKKQSLNSRAFYKNRFVIASAFGLAMLTLFGAVLWSLDSRLAENNRHRASAEKTEPAINSVLPPPNSTSVIEEDTTQSSINVEL